MRPLLPLSMLLLCAACAPATSRDDGGLPDAGSGDGGGSDGGGGATLPIDCNDVTHHAHDPVCSTPGAGMPVGTGPSIATSDGFPQLGGGFVRGTSVFVAVQVARTVSATDEGAVLSVDTATGARTLVTGQLPHATGGGVDARGAGPAFTGGLRDVQPGPDGDYALAPGAVFRIDASTGDRTQVWDETTSPCDAGGGLTTSTLPSSLAVGPDGTVYVPITGFSASGTPAGIGGIRAGTCRIVTFSSGPAGTDHGTGASPANARYRALRFAAGAIWATTDSSQELFRIDPATGARTRVSASFGTTLGAGPELAVDFLDVSADGHHAWTERSGGGGEWLLTSVDLTTGNRTGYDQPLLGPASMGQGGPVWAHPTHAWVILGMATALVLYDPATHAANVLSN